MLNFQSMSEKRQDLLFFQKMSPLSHSKNILLLRSQIKLLIHLAKKTVYRETLLKKRTSC
jgi:hypothetical protein